MIAGREKSQASSALQACDPSCERDTWVRIAMGAQAAGIEFESFDAWSARGWNYSASDARSLWQSIKPDAGIGPGTLFDIAQAQGWRCESSRPAKAARTAAGAPNHGSGMPSAAELWQRFPEADASHPYIVAKSGRADGLRMVPQGDPLRVAGLPMAGALVVPVVPLAGGEPTSLQFIATPAQADDWNASGRPGKLNLPGKLTGCHVVGAIEPGGLVYVVEGIAHGWACWKATGAAAVVTFGSSRFRQVAADLRARDPAARLVLVPDAGMEDKARDVAGEVGAAVAAMPTGSPRNFDANDLALRDGFDALEVLLTSASAPPRPEPRYRLLTGADLRDLPPLDWRIRGILPATGTACLYGPSASGKSFLALDMAASIAQGCRWFGYRVKAAPVVYVALEGEAGFRVRVAAWEQANGRPLPQGLRLVLQPFKLTEPDDVDDLAAAVRSAGNAAVTIVDTLNRAAPDADENASADMGRIIEATKTLQRLTAGLVLAVHHTGKDAAKGLRGHSSLLASLDAAVEVTRDGDRRDWKVSKAKDGQDGAAHPFRLEVVDMGTDDDGEPVTSCTVVPDASPAERVRSKLPKGGNQKIVLDALGELLRKSASFGQAGAPPQRPCVMRESALEAIASRLPCEPLRQKERTQQAINGLVASRVLTYREGWLWLP